MGLRFTDVEKWIIKIAHEKSDLEDLRGSDLGEFAAVIIASQESRVYDLEIELIAIIKREIKELEATPDAEPWPGSRLDALRHKLEELKDGN